MRRGIDERPGWPALLLPAEPPRRTVLRGLPPSMRDVLLRRFPGAVVDGDPEGADLLVCSHPPPAFGGATLAVVGGPRTPRSALLLGPLGKPDGFVLPGRRAPLHRRRTPVTVTTTVPSLAEAIVGSYAPDAVLLDVLGGGCVVLHARSAAGEVAIRFPLTQAADRGGDDLLREIATLTQAAWLPQVAGTGEAGGVRWTAYAWAGAPRTGRTWSGRGEGWRFCREVADELGRLRTGTTGPGWADGWLDAAEPFGPEARAAFAQRLAALPDGVPTAWCHGDLWPGNVVFDRTGTPTVLDWDNARRDAPAGIDGVLVEVWRRRRTFGVACREVCAADSDLVVGDRAWSAWAPAERTALVSAAFLLHATQRDPADLDAAWQAANLAPFLAG